MKSLFTTFLCALFIVFFLCSGGVATAAHTIALTTEEQQFIATHPTIKVANETNWPPYDFYESGRPVGLCIDYISLIAQKAGIEIEFVTSDSWAHLIDEFKEKKIDIMPVFYKTESRKQYTLFTPSYTRGEVGIFVNDSSTDIFENAQLLNKKIGIQKSHGAIPLLREQVPAIEIIEYDSTHKLVNKLATGELDAIIGNPWLFTSLAKKKSITNIHLSGYVELTEEQKKAASFHIGVRKDWPVLHSIIRKAMNAVTDAELQYIQDRWAHDPSSPSKISIPLTDKEKAYILAHPIIKVSNSRSYSPYDFAVGGKPMGYSVDMLNLLADRIGLTISYVNGPTWPELVEMFKQGQLDLLHTLTITPDRLELGNFSHPYHFYDSVFVTQLNGPELNSLQDLNGLTIAVAKGWAVQDFLERYSTAKLLLVDNLEEMLRAVENGQADATTCSSFILDYHIQTLGFHQLKQAGDFKAYNKGSNRAYHFMAQRNSPELISMLNKALASLTPQDKAMLEDKWIASTPTPKEQTIKLTSKEKEYIKNNPTIVLASGTGFDPFTIRNQDGTITGLDVDIARQITQKTGLQIEFALGNWKEIQNKAIARKYDGLSSTVRHPDRAKWFNFSKPYATLTSLVIVKKGNPKKIYTLHDLDGKKIALQKGNMLFETIVENNIKNPIRIYKDEIPETLRAVISEEADYTVLDETAFFLASKLGLAGVIESAFPVGKTFEVVYSLRNDSPELLSIFNKGITAIQEQDRAVFRNRWLGSNSWEHAPNVEQVSLTPKEIKYLAQKDTLTLGIASNRMPYEGINSDNNLDGMAANYLPFIEQSLGRRVKIHPIRIDDPITALKEKKCDFILMGEKPSTFEDSIRYTTSFLSFPYVIATTNDTLFIEDINQQKNKLFTITSNDPAIESIRKLHPNIKLNEVSSVRKGLTSVEQGTAYGFIGSSALVTYTIQNEFMTDMKIAGKLPINAKFSIGTNSYEPHLHNIAQKVVGLLTTKERWPFINKWIAVKFEQGIDYSLVWKVIGATFLILTIILFWNRKLNKARTELQRAMTTLNSTQEQLEKKNALLEQLAVTDRLTGLNNRMKLDQVLLEEVNRSSRYGSPLSIIILDIDHFKSINDEHGHQEGDVALINVAKILTKNVRQVDIVGRWGGEEFLIICPETPHSGAQTIAEKLRIQLKNTTLCKSPLTGSFGVAELKRNEEEADLLRRADKALYAAKHNGRNQVITA
ncbi:MAG: transporter substrate-binding domain-containing protein [Desulfovibrio sp.]